MLEVTGLRKYFRQGTGSSKASVHALERVSFSLQKGRSLGLVGESGSGKSTLARCLVRIYDPDRGAILWDGTDVVPLKQKEFRPFRRSIQYVFQDPYSSLDPRMRIRSILEEPLKIHSRVTAGERQKRILQALESVGLHRSVLERFPREFSGGQRQRISLARALVQDPDCLILDEPVSALDVSIQAQFLNLLVQLRREKGYTCIFISHDLAVVRRVCDEVIVLYLGSIVEKGPVDVVFSNPKHPYTRLLLDSIPGAERKSRVPEGEIPSNTRPPSGCPFHTRCPMDRVERCYSSFPDFREDGRHSWACHLAE